MAAQDIALPDTTSEERGAASLSRQTELGRFSGSNPALQFLPQKGKATRATSARHTSDLSTSTDDSASSLNSSYELITEDEVITSKWPGYGSLVETSEKVRTDGQSQQADIPHGMPDPKALRELEVQAAQIAESLTHMLGNMQASLRAMSGRTLACTEAYRDSVERMGDVVDENIKLMYSLISKCDNISYSMKFIAAIADQIKSIKQTLTIFEQMCK